MEHRVPQKHMLYFVLTHIPRGPWGWVKYQNIFVPHLFGDKPGDIVFGLPSVPPPPPPPPKKIGILCMELLLQFYSDCFETLQVVRSWYEDVHIV